MSLIDDMLGVFVKPVVQAGSGESLTYTPKGGSPRTITGVVEDIKSIEIIDRDGTHQAIGMDVAVDNDGTTGINAPQIEDCLARASAPSELWDFYRILGTTSQTLRLQFRRTTTASHTVQKFL